MDANPDDDSGLQYSYKPNLMGSAWEFALEPEGVAWQFGRRSGLVRYDRVERVRMSYRPASLQSHRFVTEVWSPDNPKMQIYSTSFRGLMEMARQDAAYAAFVSELHRRLAAVNSTARFSSGIHPVLYWFGAAIFAVLGLVLLVFLVRTLMAGDWRGGAVVAAVLLLFGWQSSGIFSRNRPQTYRADAPPAVVLPRA